jgi:hypothetical protein
MMFEVVSCSLIFGFRHRLGYLFVDDDDVVALVSKIACATSSHLSFLTLFIVLITAEIGFDELRPLALPCTADLWSIEIDLILFPSSVYLNFEAYRPFVPKLDCAQKLFTQGHSQAVRLTSGGAVGRAGCWRRCTSCRTGCMGRCRAFYVAWGGSRSCCG